MGDFNGGEWYVYFALDSCWMVEDYCSLIKSKCCAYCNLCDFILALLMSLVSCRGLLAIWRSGGANQQRRDITRMAN